MAPLFASLLSLLIVKEGRKDKYGDSKLVNVFAAKGLVSKKLKLQISTKVCFDLFCVPLSTP